MAVWVRKGEDGSGLLFPVRDNHLLLRSIAAHWQLNPSTILVGDLALTADEDGKSIFTIDDIRAYSSAAGLGDGCTKQSAFLIAGQPASTGVTSTITVPKKNEAGSCSSFPALNKLPDISVPELQRLMDKACNEWVTNLIPMIKALSGDEGFYKKQFPLSCTPVCSVNQINASLLWEGVAEGQRMQSLWSDREPVKEQVKEQIIILLAPSGSGKTRVLIDQACQTPSLFFVGKGGDFGAGGQGSTDVRAVAKHIEYMYAEKPEEEISIDDVTCAVAAMVASRFFLFWLLKRLCPELTQRDWTFFQLEYAKVNDLFRQLTKSLLRRFVKKDGSPDVLHAFMQLIFSWNPDRRRWNGDIILDEAQIVDELLPGRFHAENNVKVRRSFLHPFLASLGELGLGSSIYVAGTGEGLLKIRKTASGSLKRFSFNSVYSIPGFSSVEELGEYMKKFVDTSLLDLEMILHTIGKRRRFIASALEMYMEGRDAGTSYFLRYGYEVCTKTGSELGLLHSLKDDVMKFLSRYKEGTLLRQAALAYEYYGMPVLLRDVPQLNELLNCSLGEFVSGADVNQEAGYQYLHPGVQDNYGAVRIAEPLVVRAILLNIPEGERYGGLIHNQLDPSGLGTCYEPLICPGLHRYFSAMHGVSLSEKLRRDKMIMAGVAIDQVYDQPCALVTPSSNAFPLVKTFGPEYGLERWITDVESGSAPTFFHLGRDGFGRVDIIFLLKCLRTGRYVPVLVQVKTGPSFSMDEAFESAAKLQRSPELEYALETLRGWCSTGYLELVIAPLRGDLVTPQKTAVPGAPVQPLKCLVRRENIMSFGSAELNGLVATFKKNIVPERTQCQATTLKGTRCACSAKEGTTFCGIHSKK